LLELNQQPRSVPPATVYLVNQGADAQRAAFRVAEMLRSHGLSVLQHSGGGSFKTQMKRADASGASVAVILGEDEIAAGEASVKPLRIVQDQFRVREQSLAEAVRKFVVGD